MDENNLGRIADALEVIEQELEDLNKQIDAITATGRNGQSRLIIATAGATLETINY